MPTQIHNFGATVNAGAEVTLPLNNAIWSWDFGSRYTGTVTLTIRNADAPGTSFPAAIVSFDGFDAHWRVSIVGTNYAINPVVFQYNMVVDGPDPTITFSTVPFATSAIVNAVITRNS
jgi:hypothetical protein